MKKKQRVRVFAWIMAVLMGLSLTACGSGGEKADYGKAFVGTWSAIGMESDGETLDREDMEMMASFGMEVSMELSEDGTGTLNLMGEEGKVTWKATGENKGTFELSAGDMTDKGDLKLDKDQLQLSSKSTTITFEKSETASKSGGGAPIGGETKAPMSTEPETEAPTKTPVIASAEAPTTAASMPVSSEAEAFWNGDFYGYWVITSAKGTLEEYENCAYDCLANLKPNPDGTVSMVIWDADLGLDNPVSEVTLSIGAGISSQGAAMSEEGYFMDQTLEHADWILDPGTVSFDKDANTIWLSGDYEEEDGDSLSYTAYLKPWGASWDEFGTKAAKPNGYYSWYLPLVERIEVMPDTVPEVCYWDPYPENVSGVQYYMMTGASESGTYLDEETCIQAGLYYWYLALFEDGTGEMFLGEEPFVIAWKEGEIYDGEYTYSFERNEDEIWLNDDTVTMIFAKEGSPQAASAKAEREYGASQFEGFDWEKEE